MLTWKCRLLPSKGQHDKLRASLDHTRDLYNAALEERIDCYKKTGKGRSFFDQAKGLTELRSDPSWATYSVAMQRWPLKQVDLAFAAFFRRLKAKGGKSGFPRFRGREWFKTFGFSDRDGWAVNGARLRMKGIGSVRLHLHRPLPSVPIACKVKNRLASLHTKISRTRETHLHQVTASLANRFGTIAIEKLNVKGLAAGMRAREVHDVAWGRLIQMLRYKVAKTGGALVEVEPNYTSQTCPDCGVIKRKELSERTHRCPCGCVLDRDIAAAMVILSRAGNRPGTLNALAKAHAAVKICEAV